MGGGTRESAKHFSWLCCGKIREGASGRAEVVFVILA